MLFIRFFDDEKNCINKVLLILSLNIQTDALTMCCSCFFFDDENNCINKVLLIIFFDDEKHCINKALLILLFGDKQMH